MSARAGFEGGEEGEELGDCSGRWERAVFNGDAVVIELDVLACCGGESGG